MFLLDGQLLVNLFCNLILMEFNICIKLTYPQGLKHSQNMLIKTFPYFYEFDKCPEAL